jgi:hypothetical protein
MSRTGPAGQPTGFPRRLRRWLGRVALIVVAVGLTLTLAEFTLRLLGVDPPRRNTSIIPHPIWHHWHRRNHADEYHVEAEGYRQHVLFNEHGMRDHRVRAYRKSAGTWRVALLGDSFVEALQVREEEGISRRLEDCLRIETQSSVEVLNFGCSGFSSSLQYLQLREWVTGFEPDLVICLHHFSDLTEDWRYAASAEYRDSSLQVIRPTRTGTRRALRHALGDFHLFRCLEEVLASGSSHKPPSASASLKSSYDAIVHEPYSTEDEEVWSYSLGFLDRMAMLLRDRRIPFLVVPIPIGTQIESVPADFAARTGLGFLAGGNRLEHCGYQRQVCGYCQQKDITCLNLLPAFREAREAGRSQLYLTYDQHWTAEGHALAAELIECYLRQQAWIPSLK